MLGVSLLNYLSQPSYGWKCVRVLKVWQRNESGTFHWRREAVDFDLQPSYEERRDRRRGPATRGRLRPHLVANLHGRRSLSTHL